MPRKKNTVTKVGKQVVTIGDNIQTPIPSLQYGRTLDQIKGKVGSPRRPYQPEPTFIDAPSVLARYGHRSHMWLVRLLKNDPTFPRPIVINRLRYFPIAELLRWERETAAKSTKTRAA